MTDEAEASYTPWSDRSSLLLPTAFLAIATLLFIALHLSDGWDRELLLAMRHPTDLATPIGPAWLRKFMVETTNLGSGSVLTVIVILAAGLLIVRGGARDAATLMVAAASGGAVVDLLKERFAHARPTLVEHFVAVQSASFPSAHAANSAIIFLTLGTLLSRNRANRAERYFTLGAAALLTILIGVSRVYLGVHWPSDVAGGWMLGSAWALLWCIAATLLGRERDAPPRR